MYVKDNGITAANGNNVVIILEADRLTKWLPKITASKNLEQKQKKKTFAHEGAGFDLARLAKIDRPGRNCQLGLETCV